MATLITNSQFKQFDADGKPLAAGKIYTYIVGTTTNKVTYEDEALTTAHTIPIILDAWGEATIWIDGDTKFYVTDTNDAEVRTYSSFTDSGGVTGETPVVPSPDGAVFRSSATETGYIKIQLPMGEWPNTKIIFDLNVYTDSADKAFKLTLGGFANAATTAWETATALTNGEDSVNVQFGNDGTYPCIYIGAVDSEWIRPQIAVSNFLAGEFSYDWDTWNDGWDIEITTSLGTISESATASGLDSVTDTIGWGTWQDPSYVNGWATYTSVGLRGLQYRVSNDGDNVQFSGSLTGAVATGATAFTLPSGFRPALRQYITGIATPFTASEYISIANDGVVSVGNYDTIPYSINQIFTIT